MTAPVTPTALPHRSAGASQLTRFTRFCEEATGQRFPEHQALHGFSVREFRRFWRLFVDWSGLPHDGSAEPVCTSDDCEHASFFPDLRLSYADVLLRLDGPGAADAVAVTAWHSDRPRDDLTRRELRDRVAALATQLQRLEVAPGERVVAVGHNDAELLVAALAAVAVGATLSTASPDLGPTALLSRFNQLEPVLLLAPLGAGLPIDDIVRGLPSLRGIVALDDHAAPPDVALAVHPLSGLLAQGRREAADFTWPRFDFNHPLFILFSSGTTGPPKCLVHGAGGTLIEHLKEHLLHGDLRETDTLFFQTSAGWMMWNWQLSALACGSRLVVSDVPVTHPWSLWEIAAESRATVFGTSPPYLRLCERAGFSPRTLDLSSLRAVQSTGSILTDAQFDWFAEHVGAMPLQSISGGSDIIGCFVLGNPNLPVPRGESQCRSLGLDVQAMRDGAIVTGSVGELVCCNPFPSRPLGLHGDADGSRFHRAYFAAHPGCWTHGDLIEFTRSGTARLHGRSDSVLNVGGNRIGPAEIYAVLEDVEEIRECMAVEQRDDDATGGGRIVLLVVPRSPGSLDRDLEIRIRRRLAHEASAAHVPGLIVEVPELPRTHSGKASEAAARAAVNGAAVANRDALANPDSLDHIRRAARSTDPGAGTQPSAVEVLLADLWRELLGVAPGPDDNFFELGGTSLMAVELAEEIRRRTGAQVSVPTLFRAPTLRGMAAALGGAGQAAADRSPPTMLSERPGAWRALDRILAVAILPLVVLYRARVLGYQTVGRIVGFVPGMLGHVARRAWYRATLEACGDDLTVGFGTMIGNAHSRIGNRCQIGAMCSVGWVDMGDDVMVATHTVLLDGGRQHGIADTGRPMRSQPGAAERIRIGDDVWIGAGCVVLADVASHSIVTPGSTVTRSFRPYDVLTGVPAEPVGNRRA